MSVLGAGLLVAGYVYWSHQPTTAVGHTSAHADEDDLDTATPDTPPNPGFAGINSCVECHAERVAEFKQTRHYRATCVPTDKVIPEGYSSSQFEGFKPAFGILKRPDLSLQFEMTEAEGRLLQNVIRDSASTAKSTSTEIAFAYGAQGGNDEVYFAWKDNKLYELPMVWLAAERVWGNSPFDRHGTGDFSRDMTVRCLECHNTWFNHVAGSRNEYGHDGNLLGVTCEVCHGPGRGHVDHHRANPKSVDPQAIVLPSSLSRERQVDLCAQCHSNAMKHRAAAFSYRPGQPLEDYFYTLQTKHPEDDHVANQTTYLRQSRCFQESDSLTCTTCHNPHQPRSTTNAGASSCLQCHSTEGCTDRERLPMEVRDNCTACHMPERRKIQVYFQTEHDQYVAPVKRYEHRIAVYPIERQKVLRDWHLAQYDFDSQQYGHTLSSELGDTYRAEVDRLEKDYRFLAAIDVCRDALDVDPNPATEAKLKSLIEVQSQIDLAFQDGLWHQRERQQEQAIASFEAVIAAKPDHAMAHAKLGTSYAAVGKMRLAREHLITAIDLDPNEPYAPAMLGWLAFLDSQYQEAVTRLRQAERVEPYSAQINTQLGLAYSKLKQWPESIACFRKSTEIKPHDPGAFLDLSQALQQSGDLPESLKAARRALKLDRQNDPQILFILSQVSGQLNDIAHAIDYAERALKIARTQQSPLVTKIQIHLDELKVRKSR